jgi:hypothetical protein
MNEFDLNTDDLKYLTENDPDSLQFITDQYDITKGRLDTEEKRVGEGGLSERMLESTRDFALEGAGTTRDFALEGIQTGLEDTASGLAQQFKSGARASIGGQAAQASRSGLASGGTWGMQQQMKDLTQQQAQGMAQAQRGADFGRRQAESTYDFATRQAQSAFDFGTEDLGLQREDLASDISQAEHTRDSALHQEKKRQTNLLYDEIAAINANK